MIPETPNAFFIEMGHSDRYILAASSVFPYNYMGEVLAWLQRFEREEVVARRKAEIDEGRSLFDAFAGTGISAKFAEAGGADMITTHILARFRMAGLSSMAGYLSIADANAVTLELGKRDIIPIIKSRLFMAGLLGTDPTRNMESFLDEIIAAGFPGLLNYPTIAPNRWEFQENPGGNRTDL